MQITLDSEEEIWGYRWGSSTFSSSKVYKELMGHFETDPALNWLWKSYCQPQYRVFWLSTRTKEEKHATGVF